MNSNDLEPHILNLKVINNIKISPFEVRILNSLKNFYENENNIKLFMSIMNFKSKISIRLIDYFVTKYSKNNKISYKLKENNIDTIFNIYTSYKQQLKLYQKKYFDPFSRGDRIPYFMKNCYIITTIGQLNFFNWFISKNVYQYILNNYEFIELDMNKKNKLNKNNKIKIIKPSFSIMSTKPHLNSKPNNVLFNKKPTEKFVISFN
jgi:hypothetical protein